MGVPLPPNTIQMKSRLLAAATLLSLVGSTGQKHSGSRCPGCDEPVCGRENSTGEVQVVEMVPQVPGQMSMDGQEQEAPAMLKLVKMA